MYKFPMTIFNRQITSMDWGKFKRCISGLGDGEHEVILRPKVNWDVAQMNKYFHGPVRQHFVEGYRHIGWGTIGIEDIRRYLKAKFIGYDHDSAIWKAVSLLDKYRNNSLIAPSTSDIRAYLKTEEICSEFGITLPLKSMTELKGRDGWKEFLVNVGNLSKERFKCELPTAEEIE